MRLYDSLTRPTLKLSMYEYDIPCMEQFGFVAGRSTYDAIFRMHNHINQCIHNSNIYTNHPYPYNNPNFNITAADTYLPVVYIDIAKAYDRVWIDGLLYKLYNIGIKDHLFYFYKSYLYNRSFQVVHNNLYSTSKNCTAGVVQGSISGPDLFTIYIHPIRDIIYTRTNNQCLINKFADDICLYPSMNCVGHYSWYPIQTALDGLSNYASTWKIKFSNTKTQSVVFYNNRLINKPIVNIQLLPLRLSNFIIDYVDYYKYLGVIYDCTLSFDIHNKYIYDKCKIYSGYISHLICNTSVRPSFPVINRLVQAILVPKLTYGMPFINLALNSRYYKDFNKLLIDPLRISLAIPYTSDHLSIYIESRMLNVQYLQIYHTISFIHRLLSMRPPPIPGSAAGSASSSSSSSSVSVSQSIIVSNNSSITNSSNKNLASMILDEVWDRNRVFNNRLWLLYKFQSCIKSIPFFSTTSILLSVKRHDIRSHVYNEMYNKWYINNRHQPSLRPYYPSSIPPSIHKLPVYMYYTNSCISTFYSRLRFDRALLNEYRHRFHFIASPDCPYCPGVSESVNHVICVCPTYHIFRTTCISHLSSLHIPFNLLNVLNPTRRSCPYTSAFITVIHRIRKF